MASGKIHSIQSFSTFDGPGARAVVFLQGCPVGCFFCHNPESWDPKEGQAMTVTQILLKLSGFKTFLEKPALTISGGEPLAQPEFTAALIAAAREEGWHVALDTSAWGAAETFRQIAAQANLVMLSIKHPQKPENLSQLKLPDLQAKLKILAALPVPVWLRYVLIPGWSDNQEELLALKKLATGLPNLEKIQLLPFNSLATTAWEKLGQKNSLLNEDLKVSEADLRHAEKILAD